MPGRTRATGTAALRAAGSSAVLVLMTIDVWISGRATAARSCCVNAASAQAETKSSFTFISRFSAAAFSDASAKATVVSLRLPDRPAQSGDLVPDSDDGNWSARCLTVAPASAARWGLVNALAASLRKPAIRSAPKRRESLSVAGSGSRADSSASCVEHVGDASGLRRGSVSLEFEEVGCEGQGALSVGYRVVQLDHQSRASSWKSGDHVDLPERSHAIERVVDDPAGQRLEGRQAGRTRHPCCSQVMVEVEVPIENSFRRHEWDAARLDSVLAVPGRSARPSRSCCADARDRPLRRGERPPPSSNEAEDPAPHST